MLSCEWYRMSGTLLSGYQYGTCIGTRCPPTTRRNLLNSSFPFARFYSYGQFIFNSLNPQRDPNAHYVFDSERDASQSEICRQSKNKECIIVRSRKSSPNRRLVDTFEGKKLQMTSRELFAAMQVRVSSLSLFILHGPHSGLLYCILSPWCHGVDNDPVVVVRKMASFVRCPWIQLGHT